MKIKFKSKKWQLLLAVFTLFLGWGNVNAQDLLYGIQNNGSNYELVTYNTVSGVETSLQNIPGSFGLAGVLTYNPVDQVFYCYSEFGATTNTHLLEIDACSYAITDLGAVMVDGMPAYVSEGLAYDPVSNQLYGTLNDMLPTLPLTVFNYRSVKLVRFTLGTANCVQIGTNIAQTNPTEENELDAITFTGTGATASTLFGMDGNPHPSADFSAFYNVGYTASIGNATGYYDHGSSLALRGFTYLESTDLVYSSLNNNSIVTIDPGYAFGPSVNHLNSIVTLALNPSRSITGLAWGPQTCCAASSDPLFTTISTNISNDTYWDGKIYIPDNTVITVNNATLDITTADVVFGQCSGINFVNGAELRANNTVFRPCAIDGTWRGLNFVSKSNNDHQINECTFKNAEVALYLNRDAEAFINSNTFSNCNESILVSNSIFSQSIVGNNFMTNNAYPTFTNCYQSTASNDVIHIHVNNSNNGISTVSPMFVAQNAMVRSNTSRTLNVTGMDFLNNTASISDNSFINMTEAIVIQSPSNRINIENNDFEMNAVYQTIGTSTSQVSIFNSKPFVFINNNNLINSGIVKGYTRMGIFAGNSMNISAKNNSINGFNWGIFMNNSTGINISENHITNALRAGIFFKEQNGSNKNFITCNDITMDMNRGVSIWTRSASKFTSITSNCVKDGNIGIRTQGNGSIPILRNNFIYNYAVGIDNFGHTGNIGFTGDPGLNTLWSNNSSGVDIKSTGSSITVASNYGLINATWATVSYLGTNASDNVHSNASCANQIVDYDNQQNLNTRYHCDHFNEFISPLTGFSPAGFTLPSIGDIKSYILDYEYDYLTVNKIIGMDHSMPLASIEDILMVSDLTESQKTKSLYNYYKKNGNLTMAEITLNQLNDANSDHIIFKQIEGIVLKTMAGIDLTDNDLSDLNGLMSEDTPNSYYNLAVSLSKMKANHGTYRYEFPVFEKAKLSSNTSIPLDNSSVITAFPNPFNDVVTIQIISGKIAERQDLVVYDLYGKQIIRQTLDIVSGQITINLEKVSRGTYFVVLESESEISAKQKIVKL